MNGLSGIPFGNHFLRNLLTEYSPKILDVLEEQNIRHYIEKLLIGFKHPYSLIKSGSQAKGTAIKFSSDLDYLLSIDDDNYTLEDLYEYSYEYFKWRSSNSYSCPYFIFGSPRRQNVSIGITISGGYGRQPYEIDITPARKHPGHTNDHSIPFTFPKKKLGGKQIFKNI
ncbi:MAG: hypothetical protein LBM19_03905 [Holosporales bacterium]|jgi:hypothetical protein|nr:hypothetical protein [Holosporales bacterium]